MRAPIATATTRKNSAFEINSDRNSRLSAHGARPDEPASVRAASSSPELSHQLGSRRCSLNSQPAQASPETRAA